MKRASLFFLTGAMLSLLTLCVAGASSESSSGSSEMEQLRKEIAELRRRVRSLEDRSLIVPRRDHSIITIPPYPPSGPAPRDWRPFEFNGRTYYVIPVTSANMSDPNK